MIFEEALQFWIFWPPFSSSDHCRCRCNTDLGHHTRSLPHLHHSISLQVAHYSSHHSQVDPRCSMSQHLDRRSAGRDSTPHQDINRLLGHNHHIRQLLLDSAADVTGNHDSDLLHARGHATRVDHDHAVKGGVLADDEEDNDLGDLTGGVVPNGRTYSEDCDHMADAFERVDLMDGAFMHVVHVDCEALGRVDYGV